MPHFVPLIRAASLGPTARWIVGRGLPLEARLAAAGLGTHALDDPDAPIPLVCAAHLLRDLARSEGPDTAMRIASDIRDLGLVAAVALAAGSPREAIALICGFLPRLDTHETLTLESAPRRLRITGKWAIAFDPETRHIVEQYTTAQLGALCAATQTPGPHLQMVEIAPHPVHGVEHLRPWLGAGVKVARGRGLVIDIDNRVADQPFRLPPDPNLSPPAQPMWPPLRRDTGFAWSVRQALRMMVGAGPLTLDRLATAAAMSPRSVQRVLAQDGVRFAQLADEVLQEAALAALRSEDAPLAEIASRLGFSNAPAFTRAVRRWTGATPRAVRRAASTAG